MHLMTPRQARRHSVAVAAAALVLALRAGVGRANPLPTTLPTEATTRIEYGSDGYTGTIPTQVRARGSESVGSWCMGRKGFARVATLPEEGSVRRHPRIYSVSRASLFRSCPPAPLPNAFAPPPHTVRSADGGHVS